MEVSKQASWPDDFLCPISLEVMTDPVILPSGHTFERRSIQRWLDGGHRTCPVTNLPLPPDPTLIPNHALRRLIAAVSVSPAAVSADKALAGDCQGQGAVLGLLAKNREGRHDLSRIPDIVAVLCTVAGSGNARAIDQALVVLNWICSESNELAMEAIKLGAFQLCEALVNDDNCKIAKNAVELARTLEKA
uniref:U-box domain-containing protein n=1 Tax=Aegilops tauschii TaxID=37682 RepID=M8CHF0_AEGTA